MLLRALDRKLVREVANLKGQVATIALVLASGITCFIALRGNYDSLESARDAAIASRTYSPASNVLPSRWRVESRPCQASRPSRRGLRKK